MTKLAREREYRYWQGVYDQMGRAAARACAAQGRLNAALERVSQVHAQLKASIAAERARRAEAAKA